MVDVQVALHPFDTEAGSTLGRINSLHRRRKSGSGSGAFLDGSRVDAEAAGSAAGAEASSQSSRSLMHKYDSCCILLPCLRCCLLADMHTKEGMGICSRSWCLIHTMNFRPSPLDTWFQQLHQVEGFRQMLLLYVCGLLYCTRSLHGSCSHHVGGCSILLPAMHMLLCKGSSSVQRDQQWVREAA